MQSPTAGRSTRHPAWPVTAALLAAVLLGGCTARSPGAPSASASSAPASSASASAAPVSGVRDFRKDDPGGKTILSRDHVPGTVKYPMSPPVGGRHNPRWQNCEGDIYTAPVPSELAVHSLEHGAVWVTYRPGLAKEQIELLTRKVRGVGYTLMSPYDGLDTAVSVQAWGLQLKTGDAADPRIGKFIAAYRESAAPEPGAPCSSGLTDTGTLTASPGTISG